MKPVDPFYWSKLRAKSLAKNPLKRSPIKKSAVRIKPVAPKVKSLGELIKQAVTVFHKWIRERDSLLDVFRCISCHKFKPVSQMHAGHYLPAGNNGVIRLHEFNVNGQCITCNIELHGNQDNYRIGLIAKIGLENVEWLEQQAKVPFKWDRSELVRIIEKYRA
jgi:hypothetical protein